MTFTPETARAWVDVDLRALVANARTLVGLTGTRLLPMVKANGYGLGAVAVARALESLDPWGYGVASVEEGAALRAAGIARPVLVLSPLLPDAIDAHLAHDLRPTIGDLPALTAWCAAAPAVPRRDRHGDVARGHPLGRRAGAGRRRGAAARGRRMGRGCSRTSTARIRIRAPRRCSGIGSRPCWRHCRAGLPWCTPPTAARRFGAGGSRAT